MSKGLITNELINERLEVKGFGEKQSEDFESALKAVLNHYHVQITDDFVNDADFYIYEESTADGYSVFVATHDQRQVNINENVYYYDSDLSGALEEHIQYSNGDEDYPEVIYVDDIYADYVEYAIENMFVYLAERFEEEVINELIDEGYEEYTEATELV
jgi:hypothetical protein